MFWNADETDASSADERRFLKVKENPRLKILVIRVLFFLGTQ